jgi:hypothetical protein
MTITLKPGQVFSRLTVIRRSPKRSKRGDRLWLFRCLCGNKIRRSASHVRCGAIQSCGCPVKERARLRRGRDSARYLLTAWAPEYRIWHNIKQRCLNPRNPGWPNYGGRGIRICERWLCFDNFLQDVGPRPAQQPGRALLSLDRINNDGHYEPGNVRWATQKEQCNNRRKKRPR